MFWKEFRDMDSDTWPATYEEKLLVFDGEIVIGHLCMPYAQFKNYKVEWCIQGEDENIIDIEKVTHWADLPGTP